MYKRVTILLNSVENVKEFLSIANSFKEDVDILSGRYMLDAKSIMGIFSLDLSKEVIVQIHTTDDNVYNNFIARIENFIVKE